MSQKHFWEEKEMKKSDIFGLLAAPRYCVLLKENRCFFHQTDFSDQFLQNLTFIKSLTAHIKDISDVKACFMLRFDFN